MKTTRRVAKIEKRKFGEEEDLAFGSSVLVALGMVVCWGCGVWWGGD